MILSILALALGLSIGFFIPIFYDGSFAIYVSVGIMAAIDSVIGAIRADMDGKFDSVIFASGFLVNALAATFLAYIGDMLGLPLYYAALFVFGSRLFNNLALIRRVFVMKYINKIKDKSFDDKQMKLDFEKTDK